MFTVSNVWLPKVVYWPYLILRAYDLDRIIYFAFALFIFWPRHFTDCHLAQLSNEMTGLH